MIIRRGLAAFIDYSCIILYAMLLLGIAVLVGLPDVVLPPVAGQLLGVLTLTIPAVTCFILWEKGPYKATPGKRIMGLIVVCDKPLQRTPGVIFRNMMKFLPWEIAHAGLHWLFYYERMGVNIPSWVMVLLIMPQVIVFVYLLSILLDRNGRSLYDRWSDTRVIYKANAV
ncbi:RDD family protein [Chitinophaga filiformis]|uniref:RDD family protein n=1 Tax=Chitinophaga filiformis TaxID=104663 RepID=A0A1G7NKF3_CHIFI|nr:RDD family protein [Chitinophaga filiformis]SDF74431.1 RDD family protein [Chitinophaga filiformis]